MLGDESVMSFQTALVGAVDHADERLSARFVLSVVSHHEDEHEEHELLSSERNYIILKLDF